MKLQCDVDLIKIFSRYFSLSAIAQRVITRVEGMKTALRIIDRVNSIYYLIGQI